MAKTKVYVVIPAAAGIQSKACRKATQNHWIPAFAGMTHATLLFAEVSVIRLKQPI